MILGLGEYPQMGLVANNEAPRLLKWTGYVITATNSGMQKAIGQVTAGIILWLTKFQVHPGTNYYTNLNTGFGSLQS